MKKNQKKGSIGGLTKLPTPLDNQVAMYVPGTTNVNNLNQTAQQDEVAHCAEFLSNLFGGCTSASANGGWISGDGQYVSEPIIIVYAYCTKADLKRHIDAVRDYCLGIKERMQQEAVSLVINNKLYLI